jgi:hypothetical protein
MKIKRTAIIVIILIVALATGVYLIKATPSNVIYIPDGELNRIIPDPQHNRYWVVDESNGLVLLNEPNPPGGTWNWQKFPIGPVIDAAGPDTQGRLYCSFTDYKTIKGIFIFDCASASVIDTIALDYAPRGLVLSSDETRLYVVSYTWPQFGDYPNKTFADMHPETGLLLEIDIANKTVLRSVATGAMPETVYYTKCGEDERVVVGTNEMRTVSGPGEFGFAYGGSAPHDVFDLATFNRLEPRIYAPYQYSDYSNIIVSWPSRCCAAICCPYPFRVPGSPEMDDAIWIIDPITNTVVDTFTIKDLNGNVVGAGDAIVSSVYENRVYVAMGAYDSTTVNPGTGDWILIINPDTGETLDAINTGGEFQYPYFMYEMPDGRLLISCDGAGRMLVIEPPESIANTPPVCSVSASPTTYIGPAPGVITFNASQSYDPDQGDTISFSWDFNNDGTFGDSYDSGTDSQPVKNFTQDYSGPISVRVTDNHGAHSDCSVNVMIDIT